ncbi:unnamed protein product [Agarophyton chilense]
MVPMQYTLGVTLMAIVQSALCHSTISQPQPFSPGYCRLDDIADANCPGPCDLKGIKGGYSNFNSPDKPAAVYSRGQTITIKYHRNNHGPGGFIRLSLVKPEHTMDKAIHEQNAFHYSCWGAIPVAANTTELSTDNFGFTIIGNDGEKHSAPIGYYVAFITLPQCIPDGNYVLGWVWFGGTGSNPIQDNDQMKPQPWGYFGDYWACSYVRVRGGAPLLPSCNPVFVNDMKLFSSKGCMSANNAPGVCAKEPCEVTAFFRRPRSFENGGQPPPITPANF